ncbi:hypothetical protein [Streptomyces sp. NPDC089799]|uniref:hypothetical protein n=1 Tax=Streptomyces sp. NPDC089799 TaxID=3155066 RepID=UPI00344ABB60
MRNLKWRRRLGRDEGQTAFEYLGIIVVVVLIIGAIVGSGVAGMIATAITTAVGNITGGGGS